jgi:hypothetical protein
VRVAGEERERCLLERVQISVNESQPAEASRIGERPLGARFESEDELAVPRRPERSALVVEVGLLQLAVVELLGRAPDEGVSAPMGSGQTDGLAREGGEPHIPR